MYIKVQKFIAHEVGIKIANKLFNRKIKITSIYTLLDIVLFFFSSFLMYTNKL